MWAVAPPRLACRGRHKTTSSLQTLQKFAFCEAIYEINVVKQQKKTCIGYFFPNNLDNTAFPFQM